jgi:HEAT repeat protein
VAGSGSEARTLEQWLQAIDDDPDPLHLDMTPAVRALGDMGPTAVPPLLDLMLSGSDETRLHAQRALELVVYRRHGFEPGQGFPSPADEQAARDELVAGGYDHAAEPDARRAAVERLRLSLEDAGEA